MLTKFWFWFCLLVGITCLGSIGFQLIFDNQIAPIVSLLLGGVAGTSSVFLTIYFKDREMHNDKD